VLSSLGPQVARVRSWCSSGCGSSGKTTILSVDHRLLTSTSVEIGVNGVPDGDTDVTRFRRGAGFSAAYRGGSLIGQKKWSFLSVVFIELIYPSIQLNWRAF